MDEILKKLEEFDDANFKFDPLKHKYTLNGEHFISVTQFISQFHKPFDNEYWSNTKAEEEGISQEEILIRWKKSNDDANKIGTYVHDWIENYFKRIWQELPSNEVLIDRINKFNIAYGKWLYKLQPLKFEQRIFSEKWKIAGTTDALFGYNNNLFLIDWKSNKLFSHDEHEKGRYEKLLYPFDGFYKNHLNEYSIQVSLYKLILKEVGIDVKAGYLLYIGPNEEAKIYKAHDFSGILEYYLNENRERKIN